DQVCDEFGERVDRGRGATETPAAGRRCRSGLGARTPQIRWAFGVHVSLVRGIGRSLPSLDPSSLNLTRPRADSALDAGLAAFPARPALGTGPGPGRRPGLPRSRDGRRRPRLLRSQGRAPALRRLGGYLLRPEAAVRPPAAGHL